MEIIKGVHMFTCQEHSNKEIEFIKVNETLNQQEDINLFQCNFCVNDNPNFKQSNYQLIQQIIQQGSSHIIKKWPPVNDYSITTKIANILSKGNNNNSISEQIITYFSDLKNEILTKIDVLQKRTINKVREQNLDRNDILKRYQEISKVVELRTLLLNEQRLSFEKQEEECTKFIQKLEVNKTINTQLLQDLLDQSELKQNQINLEYPRIIKESILNQIQQICFFNEEKNTYNKIELIMNLVSNKSNQCQKGFLQQLKEILKNINPFIKSLQIENMFLENKQPINFQELNNQQLELIEGYVNHTIKLKNNEYLQKIKNGFQIKQINQLITNKFNFTNDNFKEQFDKILIETYPFLNQLNLNDIIRQKNKFEFYKNMPEDVLNDIFLLFKKKQELEINNNFKNTQSFKMIQQLANIDIHFRAEDLQQLLSKYPIFDLIEKQVQQHLPLMEEDILSNIQIIKSGFQQEQNKLIITKNQNNNYEILSYEFTGSWQRCVANINLEKEKKYIFRIKVTSEIEDYQLFTIGLNYKNQGDRILAYLLLQSKFIVKQGDMGVSQLQNENEFKISSTDSLLEMRVHLKEQLLEILDYPNYQFKLQINENEKQNIINFNDHQFQISTFNKGIKIELINAFIVNEFIH